jgi:hypothetical protein
MKEDEEDEELTEEERKILLQRIKSLKNGEVRTFDEMMESFRKKRKEMLEI